MKNHNSDFEGVMMSIIGDQHADQQIVSDHARNQAVLAPRSHRDRLANIGIFLGISLLTSVVIVTQWTPTGVEPSRLWIHTVVAIALAQLAIISGVSFKASGRSSGQSAKRRPARYVKPGRRIEPQLVRPQPAPPVVEKVEVTPASTGALNGKSYILFTDGSCEIDTMFGRRRFEDLDAAREFVGG